MSEQQAIIEHMESTTTGVQAAIANATRGIRLLREYRSRLISDVVTGKLDVREAAAELPDADLAANGSQGAGIRAPSDSHMARNGIAAVEAGP